jgi:TonB family protein
MENNLKLFVGISLALHISAGLISWYTARQSTYITLPVELMFYQAPAAAVQAAPAAAAQQSVIDNLVRPDPTEEIPLATKKKHKPQLKKPAQPKKEVPAPAPATAAPSAEHPVPGAGLLPGTVQPGGQMSLDTANFPYSYYTGGIVRKISRYWQWANQFGNLKTVVYFRIQRDGTVTEATVKKSSGDTLFDQQAVRAVKLSSPFPPLPDGYRDADLGVYFEFAYRE